ncbi:MAG: hypothetical protein IJ564_03510 [Alphaproteobacteria bacterium]|nr:hypothetical protein [Alphaproteobacteria bacterium]
MWFILALLTGFIYAVYHICNQESKLKAEIFIIYRGFLTAAAATPLVLIYHHIFPWQFYAIVLFQGITIAYMDYKYFQAFHKFGAENVNAVRPLTVLIVFILWLFLKPAIIDTYLENPTRSAIILASLLAIICAVIKYRNQSIGKNCLQEVFPLLLLSSLIDISNKVITEYNDGYLLALTFNRVAFTGWIIGFINLLLSPKKKTVIKEMFDINNIKQGYFLIFLIMGMISINMAMHYTPNPAYTTAITYLSVIWIILINRVRIYCGAKVVYQRIAVKWILLLLFAAITLILATQ